MITGSRTPSDRRGGASRAAAMATVAAIAAAMLLATAGCAKSVKDSGKGSASSGSSSKAPSLSAALLKNATEEAKKDAGGKKLGGSITLIDHNGGFESQLIQAALKPFEDATGVDVKYTGSQNIGQIVETRVKAGNPPDVVNDSSAGNLVRYAADGKLIPFDKFLDMSQMSQDYNPGVLQALTYGGKLYGVEGATHPQMLYVNPRTYKGPDPQSMSYDDLVSYSASQAKAGKTPWCMALSASAVTGWPAAYLIEEIYAKTYGAKALNDWGQGKVSWTSPQVKNAFQQFGRIFTHDDMINGGVSGALSTPIAEGPAALYRSKPACQFLHWGEYAAGIAKSQVPSLDLSKDVKAYKLPPVDPSHSGDEQASGWAMFAFRDTPQVEALVKYWASAAFQSALASGDEWVMANRSVKNYENPIVAQAAKQLSDADAVGFGPFFSQPSNVRSAYLDAILKYMQDPSTLSAGLAKVQSVASGKG